MSAAIYIVLARDVPGIDNCASGKALSRAEHVLTPLAHELSVRPLMDFFSMSTEDYAAQAEEFSLPLGSEGPPDEEWFTADEGLRTVRALLAHVDAHPEAVEAPGRVLDDLRDFADVLEAAREHGTRWHLGVDY
jgi:hypothetical protein